MPETGPCREIFTMADRQGRLGIGGGTLSHVTRVSPGLVGVRFAYL